MRTREFEISDKLAQTEATAEDSSRFCLTDEQILNLSTIAVHLENCYGSARDIEWAVYNVSLGKGPLFWIPDSVFYFI